MEKSKSKNWCNVCGDRHAPPTGKNCQKKQVQISGLSMDSVSGSDSEDSDHLALSKLAKQKKASTLKSVTPHDGEQNYNVVKQKASGSGVESGNVSTQEDNSEQNVQALLLKELRRVNDRLGLLEDQVAAGSSSEHKDRQKLSKTTKTKQAVYSDSTCSSDSEQELPTLSEISSSRSIQKKVDGRIEKLDSKLVREGKDQKIKSKTGGLLKSLFQIGFLGHMSISWGV